MMNVFCKTLIASALTAATLSSAYAADPLTVYGKLNVTAQSNDVNDESTTTIQSNASRFGVKGAFELSSSLEAFYTVEYEVDTGDESKDNFEARNQFVGLRGNFGAFSVGRNDTMLKVSQGKVDQFNDLSGDLKNLFKGENRIEQTATYITPSFSGFKVGVTYAADGAGSQYSQDGFSVAAMYGDSGLKKSPIYASVAYDSDVKGYEVVRATVQGKIAGLKLGGMYQQQEATYASDGTAIVGAESKTGYLLSAAYQIDAIVLKAQFQDMEDKGDSWSIGGDYKLGKPTKLFAFYTSRSYENLDNDDSYVGLGLEHKF
ncbi:MULTISPECIES: porin [Shewanella]|uniref:Porin n=1 Tax=Shewanella fidelis TaxID=173509 RepID=A0AAW8NK05_9GAMM|nr:MULTISPECIES: porin [Shewanella]MDR8522991.1 porin [Shewanella fidelis]MDW4811683.1 porin [Shewanella fidelis]MDW4815804.1 porin [Shewanella fidelis]MDW4819894.1 porin [Shewanella fidelis]MDW4824132.1 porin [Shewanella fidelis]